jgi:NitT/TauT family transport system substrate-binding protein
MSVASCTSSSTASTPLKVGTIIWPGYESIYLARDLGYYKGKSIDLVDFPSASDLMQAFESGKLDAVTLTVNETLLLAEKVPNLHIGLIMDFSNGADAILAKGEITKLADLKGKKVGVEASAVGGYVLARALDYGNLNLSDLKPVYMPVSDHESEFKKGSIDAVVTFEPTRSKLLSDGAKQLFDSTRIPGEIVDVLVFSNDVLNKNSANAQELIDGHFRAIEYMRKNTDDAARRLAPREGVSPAEFLQALNGMEIPLLFENKLILSKQDQGFESHMNRVNQFMYGSKLIKASIDPMQFLDDHLVKASRVD